jgi:FtsP/CotA-like multicopper oxidase with cupredoxin domain
MGGAESAVAQTRPGGGDAARTHGPGVPDTLGGAWRMPPMRTSMPMLPPLMRLRPSVTPFLPDPGVDPITLPEAVPSRIVELSDGDTLALEASFVRRTIGGRSYVMYAFNGQYPGPLIRVPQGATIVIDFTNRIDLPTAVHWHGVRVENRYDGVPGVTQDPVPPGGRFVYHVRFRDAGIYWYHPHHREDIQQDLGLYGNMFVEPLDREYFGPANREEFLLLDDLLVDERGIFPYGREAATHTLMGRFGNVLLVNGEPAWTLDVKRGEVVRFFLTNASNTRLFNLAFGDARMKVVGADIGRFEREEWVSSVVLAPAQRYVIDVRFPEAGQIALENRIQAIDHYFALFYPRVDTLGLVSVSEDAVRENHASSFEELREVAEVMSELGPYRSHLKRAPDYELTLTLRAGELPLTIRQMMQLDTLYFPPVEWNDAMPLMNYVSTAREVTWVLRDARTGAENMDIQWRFRVGDVVKIRLHNEMRALHPMQHPMHFHGQRFLVLSQDGVANGNLVWKDTVLLPTGATTDILLELSNPGRWIAHCHIAEHLEAGMKMVFTVEPPKGS